MKKQLIAITILSAALCMTGCGVNINTATEQSAATPISTEEATADAQTTENTASAAETVTTASLSAAQANENVKLGKSIFGGYVMGDTAVKAKPDAASETLLTIPSDTQINVFESETGGWFMTDFKECIGYIPSNAVKDIQPFDPALGGDNVRGGSVTADAEVMSGTHSYAEVLTKIPKGTQINYYVCGGDKDWCVVNYQEKIGYVRSKYIKEIEDYDPSVGKAASELNVRKMAGEWYYINPDFTVGSVIEISADGKFEETVVDTYKMTNGTVKAENGGYAFYDSENHLYLRFTPDPQNPGEFLDDKPEDGRLASALDRNKPNAEGFYDPVLLPPSSISVAALRGIWKNADGSGEQFEISEGRSFSHGRFILTDANGKEVRGDVRIKYLVNQGGEREYCFTFYEDSGAFRFAMDATDTIQLTDLYGYQSGTPHFVRQ